jgi:tetratricopeptide (TPR) repeat protein
LWELIHSDRARGWLILRSAAVSYGKATTYLPVIELLRSYFGIESCDDPRQIRERVTEKILTLAPPLGPSVAPFLALLDVPVEEAAWHALDPPQRREQTLDAIKHLLLLASEVRPLIVVIEDLQWIDGETQILLDGLVDSLPLARLLLLVNYRPEYEHGWGSKTYYGQIRIDPLLPDTAQEMLRTLLGSDGTLQPILQLLIPWTQGNPFFLEESVRALIETKVLVGARGASRLAKPISDVRVPATVQAVLAARIDRLPEEARRILQCASVVGKNVPLGILFGVADVSEPRVRQSLIHLQATEFLHTVRAFPDPEYAFTHQLTHEVAYSGLLHERRRTLHIKVMETVEQLYPGRLMEQIERLAYHAVRGEAWGKAVTYLRQAARKASARSAYREAVSCLEQALAANARRTVPDSGESIDIRVELRNPLVILGEYRRIVDFLRDAEVAAGALGDERRLARVCASLGHGFWVTGAPDAALDYFRRALVIAQRTGDTNLETAVSVFLGQTYHVVGDYRRGSEVLEKALGTLKRDRSESRLGPLQVVVCLTWIAWCLAELGDFDRAQALGREGLSLAAAADHKYALALAHLGLGRACLQKGDMAEALDVLDRGFALCLRWDLAAEWAAAASLLGLAYVRSGRLGEAFPLMAQATERATAMGINAYMAERFVGLGEACLSAGEVEQAIEHADRGLELAHRHGERGHEAWAQRLLADATSCRAGTNSPCPEALYRHAASRAEDLGMRPLVAHCHLGLGKLYRRTDKREEAREHLTTATAMYREMGMTYWLEKAEAETTESGR